MQDRSMASLGERCSRQTCQDDHFTFAEVSTPSCSPPCTSQRPHQAPRRTVRGPGSLRRIASLRAAARAAALLLGKAPPAAPLQPDVDIQLAARQPDNPIVTIPDNVAGGAFWDCAACEMNGEAVDRIHHQRAWTRTPEDNPASPSHEVWHFSSGSSSGGQDPGSAIPADAASFNSPLPGWMADACGTYDSAASAADGAADSEDSEDYIYAALHPASLDLQGFKLDLQPPPEEPFLQTLDYRTRQRSHLQPDIVSFCGERLLLLLSRDVPASKLRSSTECAQPRAPDDKPAAYPPTVPQRVRRPQAALSHWHTSRRLPRRLASIKEEKPQVLWMKERKEQPHTDNNACGVASLLGWLKSRKGSRASSDAPSSGCCGALTARLIS